MKYTDFLVTVKFCALMLMNFMQIHDDELNLFIFFFLYRNMKMMISKKLN